MLTFMETTRDIYLLLSKQISNDSDKSSLSISRSIAFRALSGALTFRTFASTIRGPAVGTNYIVNSEPINQSVAATVLTLLGAEAIVLVVS